MSAPYGYLHNPPKRRLSPLYDDQRTSRLAYEQLAQQDVDDSNIDINHRPDLHQHLYATQLGNFAYHNFNPIEYAQAKATVPQDQLLYQTPGSFPHLSQDHLQAQQQQPVQPQQQAQSSSDDEDFDMPDAPEPDRHVSYTPTHFSSNPSQRMQQGILKRKVQIYKELAEEDKEPASPFVFDTSEYIEQEEGPIPFDLASNTFAGHTPARISSRGGAPFAQLSQPIPTGLIRPLPNSSVKPHQGPLAKPVGGAIAKPGLRLRRESLYYKPGVNPFMPYKQQQQQRVRQSRSLNAERILAHREWRETNPKEWPYSGEETYTAEDGSTWFHPEKGSFSAVKLKNPPANFSSQQSVSQQQHTATKPHWSAKNLSDSTPEQRVSPSLKRASPSDDPFAPPRQHNDPQRKIISPIRIRRRPTATQLYPLLSTDPKIRHPETASAPEETSVRRIGGKIVWTLADYVVGFFTSLCNLFLGPPKEQVEVIAVATDMSDSKRRAIGRAVSSDKAMNTPSPQAGDVYTMPGQFSDDSDSPEGPDMPNGAKTDTSQSDEEDSAVAGLHRAGTTSGKSSISSTEAGIARNVSSEQDLPPSNITPPDSRPESKQEEEPTKKSGRTAPRPYSLREHARLRASGKTVTYDQIYSDLRAPSPPAKSTTAATSSKYQTGRTFPLSSAARRPQVKNTSKDRVKINKDADANVDRLVERANKIQIGTQEERNLRESFRSRKQRLADEESAKKREEEEKAEAEKAKIEHEKEQEELRQKIEQEEKERRQKEKEEAAKEAARQKIRDQLVRPLDPEWADRVAVAMSSTNGRQVLATSPDGNDITRYDLGRILPQKDAAGNIVEQGRASGWLNDEAVNAFLATIVSSKLEQTGYVKGPKNVPSFVAYNTGWYTTYRERGVAGIKNWSRRKGIQGEKLLRAERIFFPINTGAHWTLLIISPQDHTIEYLDSASGAKKQAFMNAARQWLKMELGDKYNDNDWYELDSKSSRQQNFDDCGVFTCMNALASAKNKAFSEVPGTKGMEDSRRMIVAVLLNGGFKGDWEL